MFLFGVCKYMPYICTSNKKIYNMKAIVTNTANLEQSANVTNSGRTDGVYFYVNGNSVTVSHPHRVMREEEQTEELNWFLSGKDFKLSK